MVQLIDFQNMIYRYSSALNLSVKVNGVEVSTSALYGLIKFIRSTHYPMVFCLEGYPKLFKKYIPQYKGNRSKDFEEKVGVPLYDIVSIASTVAKMVGIECKFAFSPNQEADQVIASLSKAYFNKRLSLFQPDPVESDFYSARLKGLNFVRFQTKETDRVLIKTTDSDMYQLIVPDKVGLTNKLDSYEGLTETPKAVQHLPYYTIPVYKTLMGDISDNIPSLVKGFPKERLTKIFGDAVTTSEELDKFISMTLQGVSYTGAEDLQKFLQKKDLVHQMQANRNVAVLDFYSMPYEVQAPADYDIMAALKKYRIRL